MELGRGMNRVGKGMNRVRRGMNRVEKGLIELGKGFNARKISKRCTLRGHAGRTLGELDEKIDFYLILSRTFLKFSAKKMAMPDLER